MDATFNMETAVFNYRVAAVMIEKNHVQVHKQVNGQHWALPGGRVEVLEDSRTSITREIKEELGLDIIVIICCGLLKIFLNIIIKIFMK